MLLSLGLLDFDAVARAFSCALQRRIRGFHHGLVSVSSQHGRGARVADPARFFEHIDRGELAELVVEEDRLDNTRGLSRSDSGCCAPAPKKTRDSTQRMILACLASTRRT